MSRIRDLRETLRGLYTKLEGLNAQQCSCLKVSNHLKEHSVFRIDLSEDIALINNLRFGKSPISKVILGDKEPAIMTVDKI
jgi:hypothetical protein